MADEFWEKTESGQNNQEGIAVEETS